MVVDDKWARIPWSPGDPQPSLKGGEWRGIRVTADGGFEGLPVGQVTVATAVIDKIATERYRQVEEEGFSPEHDDRHGCGELAMAASAYALGAADMTNDFVVPRYGEWPWDRESWKPTTPRRDLIKAAALIVAEIERLDRAAAKGQQP